ncbi:NADAR family protein [Limibacter armeniacum]|uniref:NADAR family protein n=1 Tax=Limibacter armeniacum TaxID=466084 RepID=UPI002FE65D85
MYNTQWLTDRFDQGESVEYLFFWGHSKGKKEIGNFIFSQWFESPFTVEGITYKTAEHWMMAKKAELFDNHDLIDQIINAGHPQEAKKLGRKVTGFDKDVWDKHCFEIVKQGNIHKFSQHEAMKAYLLSTKDKVIVEASPYDNIWGIGLAKTAPNIENPHTWKGLNLLGFALMAARDFLNSSDTSDR